MGTELKQVSKEEFNAFLDSYPRPLKSGVTTICEPPIRHYFDDALPSNGESGSMEYFFDIVVAKISLEWMGEGGQTDPENSGKFWKYFVATDIVAAPVPSIAQWNANVDKRKRQKSPATSAGSGAKSARGQQEKT